MAGKSQGAGNDALKRFTLYSMRQYHALPAGATDATHRHGLQPELKVPGNHRPFTNLEIEHILPNKPEDDLQQSDPGGIGDGLR